MIVFIVYILVLIYLYEFYRYITRLRISLQKTNIEEFKTDPYCKTLPANHQHMSENVLKTPIYSLEALRNVDAKFRPLPADDTRAYRNPDFDILLNPYQKIARDCPRIYMSC